jgi:hypothetical protein
MPYFENYLRTALGDPGALDEVMNLIGTFRDTLVSSAEVLALNATPVEVVPAPGAGKYLEFLGAHIFLDFEAAAYAADAGEDLIFSYTDGSGDIVSIPIDGEEFQATEDSLYIATPISTNPNVITHADNAPIVVSLQTGEWATGDSPLKIRVFYRVIDEDSLESIA